MNKGIVTVAYVCSHWMDLGYLANAGMEFGVYILRFET